MIAVLWDSPVCIPHVSPMSYYNFICLLISLGQVAILTNLILFTFAMWKRTRPVAGAIVFATSYLFGIIVWLFSAVLSFTFWGLTGLLLGLILLGVGVVPMAMLAAAINSHWDMAGL